MGKNFLLLNSDKTELLVVRPAKYEHMHDNLTVNIDGCIIPFNSGLTFRSHIKALTKTAFFHLCNIAKIQPIISLHDAETLIHAFVSSRLDYCNALLSGCATTSLQLVQNAAARIFIKSKKFYHITPILASFTGYQHKLELILKFLFLTYKALHGLAPAYLSELIIPYTPARPLRSLNALSWSFLEL